MVRQSLRTFLDSADSANPYQDPQFFSGCGPGEVHLLIEKEGRPVFFALGFENAAMSRFLPGLKSLVVPKGPVADDPQALLTGLKALKKYARERQLCSVHITPQINEKLASSVTQGCGSFGFYPVAARSPTMTLRLNVCSDMDRIAARFHKGTRYEVNRAYRIGINVRRAKTEADFLSFYRVYERRALHKGWSPLPIESFTTLSERVQMAPKHGAVFLSEYKGEVLGGALLLRAGPRVHYVYGAVAEDIGNLPGLYPVFHRAIEWAKEIGCTEFDFGGYGSSGVASVRRFKEGFGGEVRTFPPAYCLSIAPLVSRLGQALRLFRS
jgi:lipid II:glycine glycyltransferase (peptidoglycan interpeptide bridge formation enzyme)